MSNGGKRQQQKGFKLRLKRNKGSSSYNVGPWQFFTEASRADNICPVHVMRQYVTQQVRTPGVKVPMFMRPFKSSARLMCPVKRADIDAALKKHAQEAGCEVQYMSSHSLRIGGAFHLANAGVKWEDIMLRGRWKPEQMSEMAVRYARFSDVRLQSMTDVMTTPQSAHFLGSHK